MLSSSSGAVSCEQRDFIGIIRIHNPPVNALSRQLRAGIAEAVAAANRNSQSKVVLLISEGSMFSAGADLGEFDTGIAEPSLQKVQAALESSPVPVVAALHGLALGGGLELAMACHYRVAHKSAKLGLPEITLGIVPGAGGTQRLPRLIGARAALDMILSGAPITASDAKAKGLVDDVVEGDLLEEALKFCRRLVDDERGLRPTRDLAPGEPLDESEIAEAMRTHARALRGRTTQALVVEAIRAAVLPFAEGAAIEAELANRSLATLESQALRHVFFAGRESGKVDGVPRQVEPPCIERVAIIGAGTMGSGIAMAFADSGRSVTLIDNTESALARSRENLRSLYDSGVKRGRITQETANQCISRIAMSLSLEDAASADVVVEAVFEDLDLKKEILSKVDRILPPNRLIASNTSTLSLTELGRSTEHPGRVAGLHFFVPAHASKLLEIVRGNDTSPAALSAALYIAKLLKKIPVFSRDAFGFIGNRMMLDGYFREAEQLLLEGATPVQVDTALEKFGFAMGPQRVSDLGGNDVGTKVRVQLFKHERRPDPYFVIADCLTESGWLGQKTGRGFYRYESGQRDPQPDPEVENLIRAVASERNISQRAIGDEEVVERCTLALINVGAMVLEEGIASRASDIDVVWTSGYGFPRHLGGPMFYADTLGLDHVAKRIRYYHERLGHYWRPAKLIEELAADGSNFDGWDRKNRLKPLQPTG
jgi:3-hydroxyacyl-CoA dehydrogenase